MNKWLSLACALLLSACSFERDGGFERQFSLEAASIPQGTYRATSHTLKVKLPSATPPLDTDRIALVQFDGRQDYIANAKWADFLPVLVQSALVRSFANSGRYGSVMADDTPLPARYLLVTEIEHFELREASGVAPYLAHIRLRMKLLPQGSTRVLTQVVLENTRPVRSTQLHGMMATVGGLFEELQAQAIAKLGPR